VRICCVVSSLGAGGAERTVSLLANAWAARGRPIAIVTLTGVSGDAYALDHRVERIGLDLERDSRSRVQAIVNNLRKVRGLRHAVASLAPDVVISFVDKCNVLTLVACAGLGVPVVVSEQIHPAHYEIGRAWSLLRRLTYLSAAVLVVQCEAIRAWAIGVVPHRRIQIVPSPVGEQFAPPQKGEHQRKPIILAVGRLTVQKGFDLLIKAFQDVVLRHPHWSLVIIGQGPQEGELRRLARGLPPGSIVFPGVVTDPERYYRESSLFVLPSRFEGFPNVLLEAMASGCPVIATDCPGGTSEIIRHGYDGLLAPPENVEALAKAMDQLMSDSSERDRLGSHAVEVSHRFAVDRIVGLWEEIITSVTAA
jgi:glycosyltransferase involved in cell wall biosynthesis